MLHAPNYSAQLTPVVNRKLERFGICGPQGGEGDEGAESPSFTPRLMTLTLTLSPSRSVISEAVISEGVIMG